MYDTVTCPFCGEPTEIDVDAEPGMSGEQTFVQDCDVCCHPMTVRARVDEDGEVFIDIERA